MLRNFAWVGLAGMLTAAVVFANGSEPVSAPAAAPAAPAAPVAQQVYNDGVKLLNARKLTEARAKFEQALSMKEDFAEAHNNLAFVLRRLDAKNKDEALKHYGRALELNPKLGDAYMYRGALYVMMLQPAKAREDYATLVKLNPELAAKLKKVIDSGKEDDASLYGISGSAIGW